MPLHKKHIRVLRVFDPSNSLRHSRNFTGAIALFMNQHNLGVASVTISLSKKMITAEITTVKHIYAKCHHFYEFG
jgi:hypothetical protein